MSNTNDPTGPVISMALSMNLHVENLEWLHARVPQVLLA